MSLRRTSHIRKRSLLATPLTRRFIGGMLTSGMTKRMLKSKPR